MAVRGKLYELLVHCIPPDVVLKNLAMALLSLVDSTVRHDVHFISF